MKKKRIYEEEIKLEQEVEEKETYYDAKSSGDENEAINNMKRRKENREKIKANEEENEEDRVE